jgi:hypothetical protein
MIVKIFNLLYQAINFKNSLNYQIYQINSEYYLMILISNLDNNLVDFPFIDLLGYRNYILVKVL